MYSTALGGIRVLDLSQLLSGPLCSLLLADMGAEIIKIEPPGKGDAVRSIGNIFLGGESSTFLSLNSNKKSLTLNLKKDKGREIFFKLAAKGDVVLENFRPGTIQRLGAGYETVRRINPRIIYASISAFGQKGIYKDKPGIDPIAQALSGVMSITGEPGRPPVKVGSAYSDFAAAMMAAYGVMVALFTRERTGKGQRVETSLLDAAVFSLAPREGDYFATGEPLRAMGSGHAQVVPYQAFMTKDENIYVAVLDDRFWRSFCPALGLEHLANDPRFVTNVARVANREELLPILEETFKQKTAAEWLEILTSADVPCAPIQDFAMVFNDPQVLENEMVVTLVHPTAGNIKVLGVPVKLSETPGQVTVPPPLIGQHTEDILLELGYTSAQVRELREEGVV